MSRSVVTSSARSAASADAGAAAKLERVGNC